MGFEIIRKTDVCRAVPKRWSVQYANWRDGDKEEISHRLKALSAEELTPENIGRIIGNDSWTETRCDECEKDCEVLLRLGDEPDYEARWLDLCEDCLKVALDTLRKGTGTERDSVVGSVVPPDGEPQAPEK